LKQDFLQARRPSCYPTIKIKALRDYIHLLFNWQIFAELLRLRLVCQSEFLGIVEAGLSEISHIHHHHHHHHLIFKAHDNK